MLQSVCEIPHFFSFFFTKSLVITSMFISSELLSVLSMLTVSDWLSLTGCHPFQHFWMLHFLYFVQQDVQIFPVRILLHQLHDYFLSPLSLQESLPESFSDEFRTKSLSLISSSKLLASLSVECFLFLFQVLVGLFGLSITGISSLCEFECSDLKPSAEPRELWGL